VLGLPLLAAPFAIVILWRRGRSVTADVDASDRATAPWH